MYLPSMGGGDEGQGGGLEFAEEEPAATPSTGPEGLVYPGPQVMRSESPLPDGGLQTLLQPELEDLPLLEESVDLPNFISMPEVRDVAQPVEPEAAEPSQEVAVEPARPALERFTDSGTASGPAGSRQSCVTAVCGATPCGHRDPASAP